MGIKATIMIDDDRWAKHPYGVKFDDEECNREFYTNGVDGRDQCYRVIERAKAAGYDLSLIHIFWAIRLTMFLRMSSWKN